MSAFNEKVETVENPQQAEAFEAYLAMGKGGRSVRKLAAILGINERKLFRWSVRFNWQKRIEERDKGYAAKLAKKTDAELLAQREMLSNLWISMLEKWIQKKADGELSVSLTPMTVADAERITKMILLLQGEPTEELTEQIVTRVVDKVIIVLDEMILDNDLKYKIYERLSGITKPNG